MMLARNFKRFFSKTLKQPAYAAAVFKKRLAAHMYYRFSDGRSSNPEALTLFLTHRCNLHCRMCGQWGDGGVTKKAPARFVQSELPFDDIKKLSDEVAPFRPNITLFGGEPLLHSRIADIVRYVRSKKMHCLMITNGSLLAGKAESLVAGGLDELNVSLDGDAALHDKIRGMDGLFQDIMAGLKKVNEIKDLTRAGKPLINIQCTITKYNCDHLERMIGVAREAGAASLTFHNLIFIGKKLISEQKPYDAELGCSSEEWEGFDFEPGVDPRALFEKMRPILAAKHPFSVDFYPSFSREGLVRYYDEPCFAPSGANKELPPRCLSPWIVAYVFPDGEVRPCLNCTYLFGNIKAADFGKIWNSQNAVKYRRVLKKNGIFPLCRRCTELYRY